MNFLSKSLTLIVYLLISSVNCSVNGGNTCLACDVIVSLVEQLSVINNSTIEQALNRTCSYLPQGLFQDTCFKAVDLFGPIVINGLYAKETPDVICQALKLCRVDAGQPECRLYPAPKNGISLKEQRLNFEERLLLSGISTIGDGKLCDYDVFKPTLRGTDWRGKDCNDASSKVYPGRKTGNDTLSDSNCNGIYGIDPSDGVAYEEKFCTKSGQLGLIALGDSVTAHFHLPEQWFDATTISTEAFKHVAYIIENEGDWPHLSGSTGHIQNEWPIIEGNTSSLYLKLWKRNRCNFRDYQNIGVNGADTVSMNNSIVNTMARDAYMDQPVLLIYSLVGNDVCNGHPDTFAHMTQPDKFYKSVLDTMRYLDTKLPYGSHVLMTGLGNGSYLYGLLGDRVHPLGRLRGDVKYSDLYSYLSCLQSSPCNGWMTTNDTIRANTTAYASFLSGIVKNITETQKFQNFDMLYQDFPIVEGIERWVKMGGEPWQLIEPVDGFHTSQYAHAIFSDIYWEHILANRPNWIPQENPFNDEIAKIFGDQGGY